MSRRFDRLLALRDSLEALLDCFEGAADGDLDVESAWTDLQQNFRRWADDRRQVELVVEEERQIEEVCQLLYSTLRSLSVRSLEAVQGELDALRHVRAKLRSAADRRGPVPARAVDLHG